MIARTVVCWGLLVGGISFAEEAGSSKEILVIHSKSTHGAGQHRNKEVAQLIKHKIEQSKYAAQFNVTLSFMYPEDTSLVDRADLVILSCDGGTGHAVIRGENDFTSAMQDLDGRLKATKAGLIVIHWATDCPKRKNLRMTDTCEVNNPIMHRWIGAYYHWGDACKSWTEKFPVKELTVNQSHPIANGLPGSFKMHDEYYWNFFCDGDGGRNPPGEHVVYIHETMAGKKGEAPRKQSPYWANTRDDGGRSVGMTSAHMYHNWANRHFFQTFANSMFWSLNLPVPEAGVDIATPTIEELKSFGKGATIHPNAVFFE